jgi:hypothetical protein
VFVYGHVRENEPFQEEAITVIVNAHGALLNIAQPLAEGQKLFLFHRKTGKEIACQVVSVESTKNGETLAGVEFTEPAPDFWNISFPPDDWKPAERKLPETRRQTLSHEHPR